jgi:hypothetical protein
MEEERARFFLSDGRHRLCGCKRGRGALNGFEGVGYPVEETRERLHPDARTRQQGLRLGYTN